jgi:3-oxoacyl-[acyl-carrier protein] reductase
MDFGLQNKTALVLAGGGGLGGAIAASLAKEGAKVVVADVDYKAAKSAADVINRSGARAHPIGWDIGKGDEAPARIGEVETMFGAINILVNNTGGPPPGPAAGVAADIWSRHFETMVLSVIRITDLVLPGMQKRGWGRVITSVSSGVIAPIPNLAVSNALRSSLVGWSKSLASEVARDGVTVNVVLPGRIATDRIRFLDEAKARREGRTTEDVESDSVVSIPLGRYGTPKEYGDVVAFLASTASSYITGSIVRVDGGYIPSI